MLADFPVLHVDLIVRRTIASCIILGVLTLVVAVILGEPLAGVGVVLGLAAATVNHRLFQLSTVHYSTTDGHMERRPYASSVVGRLATVTIVAFALLYFVRPMGFGMVGGLVAFQVLLMANALGALWRYQRVQLAAGGQTKSAEEGAEGQASAPAADGVGPGSPGQDEGGLSA